MCVGVLCLRCVVYVVYVVCACVFLCGALHTCVVRVYYGMVFILEFHQATITSRAAARGLIYFSSLQMGQYRGLRLGLGQQLSEVANTTITAPGMPGLVVNHQLGYVAVPDTSSLAALTNACSNPPSAVMNCSVNVPGKFMNSDTYTAS